MHIRLNGKPVEFPDGSRIGDAVRLQKISNAADCVRIVNGFQIDADQEMFDGDQVVIIEKGSYPPPDELRAMLSARNTPELAARLASASVAIAGLGGLGSHVAIALARAGIGHLHLVDFDIVEPSNLNRQAYRLCHLGRLKTEAMRDELAEIAPYCEVRIDSIRVTEANVKSLFAGDELICEAFDAVEAKILLVDAVLEHFPDKVLIAASGMAGYGSGNAIRTRRIGSQLYVCGDGASESGPGQSLMAPRVAICAGHQALTVLRLLAGEREV